MKYLIKLFFCILIFNIPVLADCNFERLSLGTGSEMVKSVYNIDVQQDKKILDYPHPHQKVLRDIKYVMMKNITT